MYFSNSRFTLVFSFISLVLSTPIPDPEPALPAASVCKDVVLIVDILKLNKATPFCSSFIHIPTSTVLQTVITASPVTNIITDTSTAQLTIITGTSVEIDYETTTIGTVTSYSSTGVILETTVASTTTITPAAVTVTNYLTMTTLPPAKLRRLASKDELLGRAFSLPPFVAAFASAAISDACSCLSIPTSTVTSTISATTPSTTIVTTSVTNILTSLLGTITTTTSEVPTEALELSATTTTNIVTVTSTSIAPAATVTTTETIYCGICGTEDDNDLLGGQDGCSGVEYISSACKNDGDSCGSFAYGLENRGSYSEPVCLEYTVNVVTLDPPADSSCSFKYYDSQCAV